MCSDRPTSSTIVRRLLNSEAGRLRPHAVLFRLAYWQLWRRGLRRPMRFRTVTGTTLKLIPGASDSLSGFWYLNLPDFEELTFVLHLLRPGDLFVDIGANQGGWTLVAAGAGARVFSFEPVPLTNRRLCDNIAVNSGEIGSRIQVFSSGLAEEAGSARFTAGLDVGNHRVREQSDRDHDVISVTLDRADNLLRGENPVVLKIDVEGEELGVLKGAPEVLASPSLLAVVMETFRSHNFQNPELVESEEILRNHGFVPVSYDPWNRKLTEIVSPSEGAQNTIYVRSMTAVVSRLGSAPYLSAFGKRI